jgi:hypothetical protein
VHSNRWCRFTIFSALFTVAACDEPVVELDDEALAGRAGSPWCPTWQCGFNSAEVNGRSIRELNLDGVANGDGVRIVGVVAPPGLLGYELDVQDDELVLVGKTQTLRGAALIGTTLLVKPHGLALPLPITILGYQQIPSWAAGAPPVGTYALLYPDVSSVVGFRNVCNGNLTDILATAATVLGGETYDLDSKTVVPDQDRWLTIACAGSAAAKLRLLGYGPQSDFDGEGNPASVDQRQATLKMITADYCGDGHSYTANGTPLQWENAEGTVQPPGATGPREAVWSADGALCLDHPRIAGTAVACDLPSCAALGLGDGEWLTHLPPT